MGEVSLPLSNESDSYSTLDMSTLLFGDIDDVDYNSIDPYLFTDIDDNNVLLTPSISFDKSLEDERLVEIQSMKMKLQKEEEELQKKIKEAEDKKIEDAFAALVAGAQKIADEEKAKKHMVEKEKKEKFHLEQQKKDKEDAALSTSANMRPPSKQQNLEKRKTLSDAAKKKEEEKAEKAEKKKQMVLDTVFRRGYKSKGNEKKLFFKDIDKDHFAHIISIRQIIDEINDSIH